MSPESRLLPFYRFDVQARQKSHQENVKMIRKRRVRNP